MVRTKDVCAPSIYKRISPPTGYHGQIDIVSGEGVFEQRPTCTYVGLPYRLSLRCPGHYMQQLARHIYIHVTESRGKDIQEQYHACAFPETHLKTSLHLE